MTSEVLPFEVNLVFIEFGVRYLFRCVLSRDIFNILKAPNC